jgi:hypothetical protein
MIDVTGRVSAGPSCPVVTDPPLPGCKDRAVEGAVIIFRDAGGHEAARVTSAADGAFRVTLPPGRYRAVPQPVDGLLGTAPEQELIVRAGSPPPSLAVTYDTGIR